MSEATFGVERAAAPPLTRTEWGPVKEARAEAILDAIRRWNRQYGEPPTLADWEPSRARRQGDDWRAERWEAGDWPSTRMVRNHFGTMSAAIRAADLVPRRTPSRARPHLTSPEAVLEAIVAWNARYGEPPTMMDWDPARARRHHHLWRISRFYLGDWPSIATVRHHFGTLNKAIVAAGLIPRRPGRTSTGGRPDTRDHPDVAPQQRMLALRVRSVVAAAGGADATALTRALNDLAATALSWADDLHRPG